jgi:hypothetical protein
MWDSAPQVHSRVSNINFDILICRGHPINIPWKLPKDGKVLSHLGLKSKKLLGPSTNLSAWWDFAPHPLSRVSNVNFVILPFLGGYAYPMKTPKKSKYQSWYLTSCCGLEVQNPTKTLKSDKGPCKTFDLNPKWEKLCRSLAIFHGICIAPQKRQNNKVDIWHPAEGMRCKIPSGT